MCLYFQKIIFGALSVSGLYDKILMTKRVSGNYHIRGHKRSTKRKQQRKMFVAGVSQYFNKVC